MSKKIQPAGFIYKHNSVFYNLSLRLRLKGIPRRTDRGSHHVNVPIVAFLVCPAAKRSQVNLLLLLNRPQKVPSKLAHHGGLALHQGHAPHRNPIHRGIFGIHTWVLKKVPVLIIKLALGGHLLIHKLPLRAVKRLHTEGRVHEKAANLVDLVHGDIELPDFEDSRNKASLGNTGNRNKATVALALFSKDISTGNKRHSRKQ